MSSQQRPGSGQRTSIPMWAWGVGLLFAVPCLLGLLLAPVLLLSDNAEAADNDLRGQCESAIGADPGATETATRTTEPRSDYEFDPAEVPTGNPYASLTADPDDPSISDWMRQCLSGPMRSAAYQLPALTDPNTGFEARCAVALIRNFRPADAADPASDMIRRVVYQASRAGITRACDTAVPERIPEFVAGACVTSPYSGGTDRAQPVVLPDVLAEQALCGQRVRLSALSPGDLVFWRDDRRGPRRAGIASGHDSVVTFDANGKLVEQAVPPVRDIQVKRVLRTAT